MDTYIYKWLCLYSEQHKKCFPEDPKLKLIVCYIYSANLNWADVCICALIVLESACLLLESSCAINK